MSGAQFGNFLRLHDHRTPHVVEDGRPFLGVCLGVQLLASQAPQFSSFFAFPHDGTLSIAIDMGDAGTCAAAAPTRHSVRARRYGSRKLPSASRFASAPSSDRTIHGFARARRCTADRVEAPPLPEGAWPQCTDKPDR